MSMKRILIALAIIAPGIASAQSNASPASSLDDVVVTANRFPQKQDQTGKVVTVITDSVLRLNAGRSLPDVLAQQAGIWISGTNGSPGTNPDVYLRGAATGNTLILVDGLPVSDVSTIRSTFDLNNIPLASVQRIEILKGAQSTVYGSDAVAGVINIITRSSTPTRFGVDAGLSAGSYGTWKINAGLHGKVARGSWSAQYLEEGSRGFSSAMDSTHTAGFDRDGFRQRTFRGQLSIPLLKNINWTASGQWSRYHTDLDAGAYQDEGDSKVTNTFLRVGTGLAWALRRGTVHVDYYREQDRREYDNDSAFRTNYVIWSKESYKGRSDILDAHANLKLHERVEWLVGADQRWQHTDQHFRSIGPYGPYASDLSADTARISTGSIYSSLFIKLPNDVHFEAGGRYNKHSRYGDQFTFTINPSWNVAKGWRVFANFASAFKAPSLYQIYDASVGRSDLKAERSTTWEGGVQWTSMGKRWSARVVGFSRDTHDGIDFSSIDYRYFNNNRQKDHGAEIEAAYRSEKWSFSGNYSYVTGQVNTLKYKTDPNTFETTVDGDTTYNNLFRRPKNNLVLTAGYRPSKRWYVGLTARFTGQRFEPVYGGAPVPMKAYQLMDLFTSWEPQKHLRVFFDLRNIFNTTYEDVKGFNTRGRNVMGGVAITL
jgi:vitamin B12 transporter